jgi:trans-aconitate 2-methyltransferase
MNRANHTLDAGRDCRHTAAMSWNPEHYLAFAGERTRPAADLMARVPLGAVHKAVDLGCGPGNSTALIAARFRDADVIGVDSSAAMIAAARAALPQGRFVVGDFEAYAPGPDTDLIFANAAFQWSSDPVGLSGRLLAGLREGAVLALQVPQNYDQPSHTAIAEVAQTGPWAQALAGVPTYDPGGFARAEAYARGLGPFASGLDIWTTTYLHRLSGEDPVFGWMSSTGLRPFLEALGGAQKDAFAGAMRAAYLAHYPPEPDGGTLFAFRRLFVVAVRAA